MPGAAGHRSARADSCNVTRYTLVVIQTFADKDTEKFFGGRLEALVGGRKGQHSIRINDQWRICFIWSDAGPQDVEIVD